MKGVAMVDKLNVQESLARGLHKACENCEQLARNARICAHKAFIIMFSR